MISIAFFDKEILYLLIILLLVVALIIQFFKRRKIVYKHCDDCKCFKCFNKDKLHNQGWKNPPNYEKYENGYPPTPRLPKPKN